jgi:hypothetical protein
MAWNGLGNGANSPNQADSTQMTGVIDEDGYDFIDYDTDDDTDLEEDGEGTDVDGDNE